jgi:hypothetical protein
MFCGELPKGVRGLAEVEKLVIAAVFLNFQDKNILLTPSAMNTTYLRRQVLHLGGFNISPTAARRSSYGWRFILLFITMFYTLFGMLVMVNWFCSCHGKLLAMAKAELWK